MSVTLLLTRAILAVRHFELTDVHAGLAEIINQLGLLRREDLDRGGSAGIKAYVDRTILRGQDDVQSAQMLWF